MNNKVLATDGSVLGPYLTKLLEICPSIDEFPTNHLSEFPDELIDIICNDMGITRLESVRDTCMLILGNIRMSSIDSEFISEDGSEYAPELKIIAKDYSGLPRFSSFQLTKLRPDEVELICKEIGVEFNSDNMSETYETILRSL